MALAIDSCHTRSEPENHANVYDPTFSEGTMSLRLVLGIKHEWLFLVQLGIPPHFLLPLTLSTVHNSRKSRKRCHPFWCPLTFARGVSGGHQCN